MAKAKSRSGSEQTGKSAATLAGKGLSGKKLTPAQQRTVYASALTQAPNQAARKTKPKAKAKAKK
jgi:hypothetical protein